MGKQDTEWARFQTFLNAMLKAPPSDRRNRLGPLPAVVAVLKLLRVLLKVLPGNVNVRPADRKLEPRPKAFHAVDMAIAVHVLTRAVIDRLMLVSGLLEPRVGFQFRRYARCCPSPHSP